MREMSTSHLLSSDTYIHVSKMHGMWGLMGLEFGVEFLFVCFWSCSWLCTKRFMAGLDDKYIYTCIGVLHSQIAIQDSGQESIVTSLIMFGFRQISRDHKKVASNCKCNRSSLNIQEHRVRDGMYVPH